MKAEATKEPRRTRGFSWGRAFNHEGVMVWRLFRWDIHGKLHCEILKIDMRSRRGWIAQQLCTARHALRDRVDSIDLAAMGIT